MIVTNVKDPHLMSSVLNFEIIRKYVSIIVLIIAIGDLIVINLYSSLKN